MNSRIDAVNAKILKILLEESRRSFTEMARSCKISVGAVRMRYNNLKKTGIINGEYMHINPKFWGYEYTVDIRLKTSLDNEEEVINLLNNKQCKYPVCILAGKNFGKTIMGLALLCKLENLRELIEEIEADPKVKSVDTLVWAKAQDIHHPENLIIKPYIGSSEEKVEPKTAPIITKEYYIDETDRQIVRMLANNSRRSFSNVAKELGISTHTVIQRYKKLRKGNVLTRSAVSVDLNKLGYKAVNISFLKLRTGIKISEIRQQLLQIPNTVLLIEHTGVYDLRIDNAVANIEDVFNISEKIHGIEGIEEVDSTIGRCPTLFPFPLYNKVVSN